MFNFFKKNKEENKSDYIETLKKQPRSLIRFENDAVGFVMSRLSALQAHGIMLTVEGSNRCLNGDEQALYEVGLTYLKIGRYSDALEWFNMAPNVGFALKQIGCIYHQGLTGEINNKLALKYLTKASEKGCSEALIDIGLIYMLDYGTQIDKEKALDYFMMAAEAGVAAGYYNIGYMYDLGEGVEKSDEKAMEWYLKAADMGDMMACNNIGIMYKNGLGVPKNIHTAIQWYKKAADKDVAIAQLNLANAYNYIEEVKNIHESSYWYERARRNGVVLPQEVVNMV